MEELFLKVLNMSLTASVLILVIVVLRLLFKRAPKWITCLLWALAAVRLVCPVSFESVMSLLPSAEPIAGNAATDGVPKIHTGIYRIDRAVNPIVERSLAPTPEDSASPAQVYAFLASVVWVAGMAGMAVYAAASAYLLRRKVRASAALRQNIMLCDDIATPFILGVVMPHIYIPSGLDETQISHIIAHERAHLDRKDHWWKPLGFLILAIHWFNPLVWVAYILLCRDIELACDEKVVRDMGQEDFISYSNTLLSCSVSRRNVLICPLAFGEVGVRERIRRVLHYRKPAFWVVILSVAVCIAAAVCFLTNPVEVDKVDVLASDNPEEGTADGADGDAVADLTNPRVGIAGGADRDAKASDNQEKETADRADRDAVASDNQEKGTSAGADGDTMVDLTNPEEEMADGIDGETAAASASEDWNVPEEAVGAEEPSSDSNGMSDGYSITYHIEGETVKEPAQLIVGDGYTLLLPAEGWESSCPDAWNYKEDERIQLWVAKLTDSTLREKTPEEGLIDQGFTRNEQSGMYEKTADGKRIVADIRKNGSESVWYVTYAYPLGTEMEEGWGSRLRAIAAQFGILPETELTEEEGAAGQVVATFAMAYLAHDAKTMHFCTKSGVSLPFADVDAPNPAVERVDGLSTLKNVVAGRNEYGEVSAVIRPSPDAEEFLYLTVGLEYVEGDWKVVWCGFDA